MDLIGVKKSPPGGLALPTAKGFMQESFMKSDRSRWLWQWMAFFYERFFSGFPPYRKLLKDIIESLPPADPASHRVFLDAGCGVGLLSFELARRGHVVVGIDRSPQMVDRAKKKKQKERLDNLTFWEKDLNEEWNLPGFSCQTILLIHSLYLLENPSFAVKRLASFLVSGGEIITCNPSRKLRFAEIWKGGYSFLVTATRERGALSIFSLLTVALVMGALNFMIQRKKNRIFHCWDENEITDLMRKCDLGVKRTQTSCLAGSHILAWAVKEH
jgi:SAM-dependent methyltransferase